MNDVGNVGRYGYAVGVDCGILSHLGATDEQIKAYIKNRAAQIPVEKMAAYHIQVEIGARNYWPVLVSQDSFEHVNTLALMLQQNWHVLNPVG